MRSLLRFLACAVAFAGHATPASAADPPRTSALGWARFPGAEACIGMRDLAIAVEQRLGRNVFVSPTQADVTIEGASSPSPRVLPLDRLGSTSTSR